MELMDGIKPVTKNGKKYVTMPKAVYDRLQEIWEDAQDAASIDEAMRKIHSGEMETFPFEFVKSELKAKTTGKKLQLWREYRGLSKVDLGKKVKVSGQFISMIESNKREGSLSLFVRIAKALKCSLDDLVC